MLWPTDPHVRFLCQLSEGMSFLCYVRHEFPKVVCHPQKESHFTDISGLLHSFDSAHLVGVCADPCYTDDLPKELNSAFLKTHTSHSIRVFAAASSRPRLHWLPQMSTSSMWHTTPSRPSRICWMPFWKGSGADEVAKHRWL